MPRNGSLPHIRRMNEEAFEDLVDALDHIARTCRASNTQTRRIRWIEQRARCALTGEDWRDAEVPKMDPYVEALRGMVEDIYPLVLMLDRSLEQAGDPPECIVTEISEMHERMQRFRAGVRQHMHWLAREHDHDNDNDNATDEGEPQ